MISERSLVKPEKGALLRREGKVYREQQVRRNWGRNAGASVHGPEGTSRAGKGESSGLACAGFKGPVSTSAFTQLNIIKMLPNPPVEPETGFPGFCLAQSSDS